MNSGPSGQGAMFRKVQRACLPLLDRLLVPITMLCGWWLKQVRRVGLRNLPASRKSLLGIGVYPLTNHYYAPKFDHRHPTCPYSAPRTLPGIDWNVGGQLQWLGQLGRAGELDDLASTLPAAGAFHFNNGAFESGDAEVWYQLLRAQRPRQVIEIGSGYSTLLARRALAQNAKDDPTYRCRHVCVEPYEMPWLENLEIEVVRKRVEELPVSFFSGLSAGDILLIDSSHMIRPQGDVLYEYLELLPTLAEGVIVHIHDIFSPRDYLESWLVDDIKFWNEQYLLEAFLTNNSEWKIVGALNFLHHSHYDELKGIAQHLTPDREPGSFYIQRIQPNHTTSRVQG